MFEFLKQLTSRRSPLTAVQKEQLADEMAKQANGKGNDVEAAIGLLRMGLEEALPGFFVALEKSKIVLIARQAEQIDTALVLRKSNQAHLAVFTRDEYATAYIQFQSEYRHLVPVEMIALCKSLRSRVGLVINPAHPTFRFTFSPDQFAEFQGRCSASGTEQGF